MIIITSKRDGFRRCGVAHAAKPTEYEDDRFSEEELARLMAEPMLSVTVPADVPETGGGDGGGKSTAGKPKKETG